MKKCFKCGKTLPLICFYKHKGMKDGHLNKCKDCAKTDAKTNYNKNREQYKEYDSKREKTLDRKKNRLKYRRTTRQNNPKKYKAYQKVFSALRSGQLTKKPCNICGGVKVEAHHQDYDKPLEVSWLCRKHHLEEHNHKIIGDRSNE